MTVSYTAKVANSQRFCCFIKLLFRWRGSIYKLVWPDLFVFLICYFSLSGLYRFALDESSRKVFDKIVLYCDKYGSLIPISFVLGFYVTIVVRRWWEQYRAIPAVDTLAVWVTSSIRGDGEKERLLRRTLMRYACLSITQCFTLISPRVKKRFPTPDHFVESGLLLENEKEMMNGISRGVACGAKYPTHWVPLSWAASLTTRARVEDKIKNDGAYKAIMDEINKVKDACSLLISYDWISVPLVYTQVVTLAVYVYFLSCIMGRQWISRASGADVGKVEIIELFFPFFTVLQFFFYMGWLKVAESLLNPFGDDDDDFELNWMVDRNIQMSYLMVDEMHQQYPELVRDQFWDEVVPQELPHTVASEQYKEEAPVSSTANLTSSKPIELLPASVRSDLHMGYLQDCKREDPCDDPILRNRFSTRTPPTSSAPIPTQTTLPRSGSSSGKLNKIGTTLKRIMSISRDKRQAGAGDQDGEVFGSLMSEPERPPGQGQVNDVIHEELDEDIITFGTKDHDPDYDQKKEDGVGGLTKVPTIQEIFGPLEDIEPSNGPPPVSIDLTGFDIEIQGPSRNGSKESSPSAEKNV